jgi:hypothetical protein
MAKTEQVDAPDVVQPQSMVDADAILASLDLDSIVNAAIERRLSAQGQAVHAGNAEVVAETRERQYQSPAKYLKHYRCDTSPQLVIHARSIVDGKPYRPTKYNYLNKGWEDPDPLAGKRIQFRRGHFFATQQWEVDLVEWKMRNPSVDPNSGSEAPQIIGGNPSIYEDDGLSSVGLCEYGCGMSFVPGSNAYKAHLKATHGIV